MAQSTYSIRMDDQLKKEFDDLCEDFGMNSTTAFNIFAKAVVRERKIPFDITSSNDVRTNAQMAFKEMRAIAKDKKLNEMTLEDINNEINEARKIR